MSHGFDICRRLQLLLAAAFVLCAVACMEKEALRPVDDGDAFVKLSLSIGEKQEVPVFGSATKAGEPPVDTDPDLEALEYEKNIKTLNLYFFDSQTGLFVNTLLIDSPDNESIYSVKAGSYHVYALANTHAMKADGSDYQLTKGVSSEMDFVRDAMVISPKFQSATVVEQDGVPMASRGFRNTNGMEDGNDKYPRQPLNLPTTCDETHPATLSFTLERLLARVVIKKHASTAFDFKFDDTKIADVELSRAALVNAAKDAYAFRHASLWLDETLELFYDKLMATTYHAETHCWDGYVVDPHTLAKSANYSSSMAAGAAGWYYHHTTADPANEDYIAFSTSEDRILGYCMDNTMSPLAQIHGYSTGVVIEAYVRPLAAACPSPIDIAAIPYFYYFAGKFYPTLGSLPIAGSLPAEMVTRLDAGGTPGLSDYINLKINEVKRFNVESGKGGKCWYKVWVTHVKKNPLETQTLMGTMEFATVRGNSYGMHISSLKGLGKGDEGELIVENQLEPDKSAKQNISADITVSDWTLYHTTTLLQ